MTGRLEQDRGTSDESGVVAPSRIVLVAIVLVAVAAVTYVAGLGSGGEESDVASTASSTTSSRSSQPSSAAPSTSTSPSAAATSPSASATAKPSAKASAKASAAPGEQSSAAAPAVQRGQVSVSVFNNSSRSGLAARTSDKVKSAGWKVIGTDNWYGTIPQPTVYYPARLKSAAELLAKDAGIDRVKPAVNPMRSDRLTLIVTADYTA